MGIVKRAVYSSLERPRVRSLGSNIGRRLGAFDRFIGGETIEESLPILAGLEKRGFRTYASLLGELVTEKKVAEKAVDDYRHAIHVAREAGLSPALSIKLTHMGYLVGESLAKECTQQVVEAAEAAGLHVQIDMEESHFVDPTIRLYEAIRAEGLDNVGLVLQAYLHRTESDLKGLLRLEPNVRIVKGAYLEPSTVALTSKVDVDAAYCRLVDIALDGGAYACIATHDNKMVNHALASIQRTGAAERQKYEFQMMYGVGPNLQEQLLRASHPVRVLVPYGPDWVPYFGRRIAERPANALFALRSLVSK